MKPTSNDFEIMWVKKPVKKEIKKLKVNGDFKNISETLEHLLRKGVQKKDEKQKKRGNIFPTFNK